MCRPFRRAGTERPDSDVDIALLLPPEEAKGAGSLSFSDLRFKLEEAFGKRVDLVNLRMVSTVFKKEITCYGKRIFTVPGQSWTLRETALPRSTPGRTRR
jgi:predicted nucleotidyltransferase